LTISISTGQGFIGPLKKTYKVEIIYDNKEVKRTGERGKSNDFNLPKQVKFGLRLWNNDFKRVATVVKLGEDHILGKKELVIPPRSHAEIFNMHFGDYPVLVHVEFWREQYNKGNVVAGDFSFLCDPYDRDDRSFGFYRRGLWDIDPIPDKEIVWKFVNPIMDVSRKKRPPQPAADSTPEPFAVFSKATTMRSVLRMTEEQLKKLDEIDAALNDTINEVLDAAQKKVLVEPNNIEYSRAPAGEYLSMFDRSELKLSQSQKEALQALRRNANSKISMTLTDGQKRTIQRRKTSLGLPKRPGNSLFRATRHGLKHPAFDGKVLTPGKTLVAIQEDRQQSATEQN